MVNLSASADYRGIEWSPKTFVLSEDYCALIDCVFDRRRFTKESFRLLGIIAVFGFLDKVKLAINVPEKIAIYLDPYL